MPSLKQCRLSHLQAILSNKKKVLLQKNVPARKVPNWPQLAVKHVYEPAKLLPNVSDYLPDPTGKEEERLPERDFFWKVLYTLHPDYVDDIVKQAKNKKKSKDENLQEQKWALGVSREWME